MYRHIVLPIAITVLLSSCSDNDNSFLHSEATLHLESHLEHAVIETGGLATGGPEEIRWSFNEPQEDWRPLLLPRAGGGVVASDVSTSENALRLSSGGD